MHIKQILGIIPARGGSKTILRKNIRTLNGIPLIKYTFNAVEKSKYLSRCIVSSDDPDIINYSKSCGMEAPFQRPVSLSSDESKTIDVVIHALHYLNDKEQYRPDYIMILQPTSPLRTAKDIDNSIQLILNDPQADSLVSVVEVPHIYHPEKIMKKNKKYIKGYINSQSKIKRRQDLEPLYARNGAAIYLTKTELLLKERRIIGRNCIPYIMPKERSIDIDDQYDWDIAEFLIKKRKKFL
ncbi:MAG: acylneuraminate cytidylyltransferase family protein [Candidatus Lokiarchaeota archaeon]|nr:acylneuraminate cytidylyltransferase family protein [Candidatus Harpocratesius repetitus]